MIRIIILSTFFTFLCLTGFTQDATVDEGDGVPTVFVLGNFQESYHALSVAHKASLLSACNDDLDMAYNKWLHMVQAMEDFSNKIDYDIKGVKMWLQMYWNTDGTINHIAYFLKPNSRNMAYEDLTAFFKSFTKSYQMPLQAATGFSHYGSASFPLFLKPVGE